MLYTSQSSYSSGSVDETTNAAARNVVASVMVSSPSHSIATSAHVDPRQRLSGREKLVGDGGESSNIT